ncbi:MAG TPA: aminoglycoside 6-adenylyltransferase [Saprospiraceae bacterium]|nr:aminoglycoside 6-adenylyltransferase [Saprospiraceae bacterium]
MPNHDDERIRAFLLKGSWTNPKIVKYKFHDSDFDVVVISLSSFTLNQLWVVFLGLLLTILLPEEMTPVENAIQTFLFITL